jgi:hypothetical protein
MASHEDKTRSSGAGIGLKRHGGQVRYGTRLRLGSYFADIIRDPEGDTPIHHWIVQRAGSPQVIFLGQEADFESALDQAHECLQALAREHRNQEAAIYEFAAAHGVRAGSIVARFPTHAPSSGLQLRSSRHSIESVPDRNE